MIGEFLTESWFGNIWKSSHKSIAREPERQVLGILAFDVSTLMSKVVNLWQCLTDRQSLKLREEIANSVGIQKLVSEDEEYLMDLALAELIDNLGSLGRSVAMLGKKCVDPTYHNLEGIFDDPSEIDPKWYGWQYRLKKMDKRVEKMKRFVAATEQLYSEIEELEKLEQSPRLMPSGANISKVRLLEYQQKVFWQRQEVKNLQEVSPWTRTYDYTVRLLLRSLFTIVQRIKYVYGVHQNGILDLNHIDIDCLVRCNSMPSLVHTSENNAQGCAWRSLPNLKKEKSQDQSPSSILCGKQQAMMLRRFAPIGLTGCITGGIESPVAGTYASSCGSSFRSNDQIDDLYTVPVLCHGLTTKHVSFFNSKRQLLNAHPSTLGHAALALHYANIIILIEKLASYPHLISLDAREDLYNMLPSTIRNSMRAKLKTITTTLALFEYDAAFAAEWSLALARTLEWLSPLAHNMVRWQSELNFERQRLVFGTNVLLVQTLYFADQTETEAAIVELLMGLNYLFRFGRQIRDTSFHQSSCTKVYDEYLISRENMYSMIDHSI